MQSNSFTGRLVGQPQIFKGITSRCSFCVAESGARNTNTASLTFAAFGTLADFINKNLGDGDLVAVQFLINNYKREDSQAIPPYAYNFNASRVELLSSNEAMREAQSSQNQAF